MATKLKKLFKSMSLKHGREDEYPNWMEEKSDTSMTSNAKSSLKAFDLAIPSAKGSFSDYRKHPSLEALPISAGGCPCCTHCQKAQAAGVVQSLPPSMQAATAHCQMKPPTGKYSFRRKKSLRDSLKRLQGLMTRQQHEKPKKSVRFHEESFMTWTWSMDDYDRSATSGVFSWMEIQMLRAELDDYKEYEMGVHPESRCNTVLYRNRDPLAHFYRQKMRFYELQNQQQLENSRTHGAPSCTPPYSNQISPSPYGNPHSPTVALSPPPMSSLPSAMRWTPPTPQPPPIYQPPAPMYHPSPPVPNHSAVGHSDFRRFGGSLRK